MYLLELCWMGWTNKCLVNSTTIIITIIHSYKKYCIQNANSEKKAEKHTKSTGKRIHPSYQTSGVTVSFWKRHGFVL